MAAPTNTATTLSQKGNREDLSNVISRVAPELTPLSSNIGTANAKAVRHEWQLETLDTPTADNNALEGDDVSAYSENVTTRVSNICQILTEAFVVSGTQEKVDKAGRKSEIARQTTIHGIQLKRDSEASMLSANSSRLESGATQRRMGGLQSWIETNVDLGAGGSAGGFNTSTAVVDAPTTGTNRAFTEAQVTGVMESIFTNSGTSKDRHIYMKAAHKGVFNGFSGISGIRNEVRGNNQATIVGAADVYVSSFGNLICVPVAYGLSEAALIVDHEFLAKGVLRPYERNELSKTGDNTKYQMICEETLVCRNEKAHGYIGDLSG